MSRRPVSLVLVPVVASIVLAACGDDGNAIPTVDIDNGQCGADVRFTGEIVDWDSSDTGGDFCGVFNAMLSGISGGNNETTTAPNGRFDACIATGGATSVPVTPATTASMCAATAGIYTTPGSIFADPAVIHVGAEYSLRLFTDARRTSFFGQIGAAYDPSKGQLLVHVFGDVTRDVTLTSAHDTAQAFTKSANAWAAGTHGDYVFFPNVALDGGTVAVAGQQVGAGKPPIPAGTITDITIYTR